MCYTKQLEFLCQNGSTEIVGLTLRRKLFLEYVVIGLVPLLLIGAVAREVVHQQAVGSQLEILEGLVHIQALRVEAILEENLEHYAELVSDPSIEAAAVLAGDCSGEFAELETNTTLTAMRDTHPRTLRDITLVTIDGCVHASTDLGRIGKIVGADPLIVAGSLELVIGDLHRDAQGYLVQSLAGPIVVDGVHVGVIVVDTNMEHLNTWAQDYTGRGGTGETVFGMLDAEGANAVFTTPLRFDPDVSLEITIPMSNVAVPMVQALSGIETTYENFTDYREVTVLAATHHIGATGWGVVVKQDRSEALATVSRLGWFLLAAGAAGFAALVIAAGVIARRRTRPIYAIAYAAAAVAAGDLDSRAGLDRADELGVLARAIDDMADQLVERQRLLESEVNERTSQLRNTVRTLEAGNQDLERMAIVAAHDLSEPLRKIRVFGERLADTSGDGLDEHSRDYLERMMAAAERMQDLIDGLLEYARMTTTGDAFTLVDLEELTRLAVADLEVVIAEAGATVEVGDLPSVEGDAVHTARATKELRESDERYVLAARGANDGLWDWNLVTNILTFSPRWMSIFGYSKITNHPNEWMRRVHPDDLKEVEAAITAHVRGKTDLLNTTHRMLHADGTYRWVLVRASAARAGNGEAYRIAGSHMDITKLRNTEALLNGIHDDSDAVQVAERVRTVMRRPLVFTGGEVASTVTIGIAEARPAAAG